MAEVGCGSWLSQVRCCCVLLVVKDHRCLGPILLGLGPVLLGFCWSFVGFVLAMVGDRQ